MLLNVSLAMFVFVILMCIIQEQRKTMYNAGSTGFLNKEKTGTLRGVATVMVVFSHICQYEADFSQIVIGGRIMFRLMFAWGAVGVAIFFFLSGYGCYMSLKRMSPPCGQKLLHGSLDAHCCF